MKKLTSKVVLVTGGNSGIGRAAAYSFAREGAKVVLAARGIDRGNEVVRRIEEAGGDVIFVQADVSKKGDVEALVAKTVERYGRLDLAVNNAGAGPAAFLPTADLSEGAFDQLVAVNLKGVWLCMKYEIKQMLTQHPSGGAIVNTSSVNGLGGARLNSAYSAAKSGVLALTKSAAQEYAKNEIRINALVPGAFHTPMLEEGLERFSGGDPESLKKIREQLEMRIPLGRIGRPEEAAEAAVWLCSDAASYVTGHAMIVDGGLTAAFR